MLLFLTSLYSILKLLLWFVFISKHLIKSLLVNILKDSSPLYLRVKRWLSEFKRGRTSSILLTSREADMPKIITQIHKIVLEYSRLKIDSDSGDCKNMKRMGRLGSIWYFAHEETAKFITVSCVNFMNETVMNFCGDLWLWLNRGSIVTLLNIQQSIEWQQQFYQLAQF